MNWTLTRSQFGQDGIFGILISEDRLTSLVVLEHAFEQPDGTYRPAVPSGVFHCERVMSQRFGFDVFELQDVPEHTAIEIHPGNLNKDSSGCLLLGMGIATFGSEEMITNSREAFKIFMDEMTDESGFELRILG